LRQIGTLTRTNQLLSVLRSGVFAQQAGKNNKTILLVQLE